MAHNTDPLVDPDVAADAARAAGASGAQGHPPLAATAHRRRRPRWSLVLFAIEVVIVVALVWFSWSGGSWA